MASGVQTSLDKADSAYQKPSGGIPATDMASGVQTSLGKADTALQSSDIDNTLAVAGKAADAKKTGDEISGLKNTLGYTTNKAKTTDFIYGYGIENGKVLNSNGGTDTNSSYITTEFIPVTPGIPYVLERPGYTTGYTLFQCMYDSNREKKDYTVITASSPIRILIVPNDIAFVRFSVSAGTYSGGVFFRLFNNSFDEIGQALTSNNEIPNAEYTFGLFSTFQNGYYDGATYAHSYYRVCSVDTIKVQYGGLIAARTGFKFKVDKYNNGSFVSAGEWKQSWYVSNGSEFKISIIRETEIGSEIADIDTFVSQVLFYPLSSVQGEKLYRSFFETSLLSDIADVSWVFGTMNAGSLIVSGYRKRVTTGNIIKFGKQVKLSVASGYHHKVSYYLGDTYNSESSYTSDDIIVEPTYGFKVSIKKIEEDSNDADFKTFNNAEHCQYISEEIKEVAASVDNLYEKLKECNYYDKFGFVPGLLKSDGSVEDSSSWKVINGYIPISKGETLRLQRNVSDPSTGTCFVCYYDKNYGLVKYLSIADYAQNYLELMCQYNSVEYVRVCTSNAGSATYTMIVKTNNISKLLNGIETPYYYMGQHIDFSNNGYSVSRLYEINKFFDGTKQAQQGMAVYGNYMFVAFSQYGDLGPLNKVRVYNLTTGELISTISMTIGHGNAMQFSKEFYDDDDALPLLYISDANPENGYNHLYIYRMTTESGTLVKTLRFPVDENNYYMQGVPDTNGKILYTIGTEEGYNKDITVGLYDLTQLTENNDDTYTPLFISSFVISSLGKAFQGMKYYKGKLFVDFSASGETDTSIFVINPITKSVENAFTEFPADVSEMEAEDFDFVNVSGKDSILIHGQEGNYGWVYRIAME